MSADIIDNDSGWPYTKAKTAVLSAAAAAIREEGPRAATLKNIAGRAGITEPAIFRHFDGVDGLFSGLFSAYERIDERLQRAYDREGSGMGRLRDAMRDVVDILAASGDYAYLLLYGEQVFRGYPELRARAAELRKADERNAVECVKQGVASGDIRSDLEPSTVAAAALGVIRLTAMAWVESGFAFDLREVCEARWEDVERMFATKPAAKSASRQTKLRSAALKVAPIPAKASKPASPAAKRSAKPAAKPAPKAAKGPAKAAAPKTKKK